MHDIRLEGRGLACRNGPEPCDEWREHDGREHRRTKRLTQRPGVSYALECVRSVASAHDRHTVLHFAQRCAGRVRRHDVHAMPE